MSFDEALAGLSSRIDELNANLKLNNELLSRANAGREAAMAKIEEVQSGTAAEPSRRARRASTKEEAPETAAAPTAEAPAEKKEPSAPKAVKYKVDVSDQAMRDFVGGWIGDTNDQDVRNERQNFVKSLFDHFGVAKMVGSDGIQDDEDRKKFLWFVARKKVGLTVNLNADYDFDSDPTASDVADAADGDDMLG